MILIGTALFFSYRLVIKTCASSKVTITGLKGTKYLDKVANFAQKTETDDAIRISSEVDRIYLDTTTKVEILDEALGRRIRVEKHGSVSTVARTMSIKPVRAQ